MTQSLETMSFDEIEERLPEFGELYEQIRAEEADLSNFAEEYMQKRKKKIKKRKLYTLTQLEKDKKIVGFIEGKRIDLNGNGDMGLKQDFWKNVYGRRRLRIGAGKGESSFVSIDKCDNPNRITAAVKRAYEDSRKRLYEYRTGEITLMEDLIPFESF